MASKNDAEAASDPIVEQGAIAKEQGVSIDECPYAAQGDTRAKWFAGFGEADPEAAAE